MTTVRIVVGNEPYSYRHVHAEALRELRPEAEVVLVDPADLDAAIAVHAPHLVLCSTLSLAVETGPLAWILLYPGGANLAVVSLGGAQRVIQHVEFDELLAVVDDVSHLVLTSAPLDPELDAATAP
jgi:hypothetical protein